MSKIDINTAFNANFYGRPTIETLQPGETFKFRSGRGDQIYMKITDERSDEINGDDLFQSVWYSDQFYASLKSGQVYRARQNAEVVRVRVSATAERE